MNAGDESWRVWPPTGSPPPPPPQLLTSHRDDYYDPNWKQLDNSVNAVSFGFVATAILISMFIVMAIFERFLRPASFTSSSGAPTSDVEAQMGFDSKLGLASPKRRFSSDARRSHPYFHSSPCTVSVSARTHPLASPPPSTMVSTQSAISGMDSEESRPQEQPQNLLV